MTINKCKEKFRIVFCYFSAINNIASPLSFSDFSMKLICLGMLQFFSLRESVPIAL